MSRRGKRRGLTEEESALWSSVAKTLKPMPVHQDGVPKSFPAKSQPKTETALPPAPPPIPKPQSKVVRPAPRASSGARITFDLAPDPIEWTSRPDPGMDRRLFDKLRKGKLIPDARIDLHGMTADRAKAELTGFIFAARHRGDRVVLVITGKGRKGGDSIAPDRQGVLRHAVPQWLRAAPLGPMVLQVTPAHRKDGGTGAYYVYLRRVRG
jgi:DNA-nicking Smr family endonuclease